MSAPCHRPRHRGLAGREHQPPTAIRLDDPGLHAACCGTNTRKAMQGSQTLTSHRALASGDSAAIAARYLITGQPTVKRCFAAAPQATTLTLRFAVGSDGTVTDASADGAPAALATCVRGAMARWTFAPGAAPARYELVLALGPG